MNSMKKILTVVIIGIIFTLNANAQLNGVSVEEASGYRTVYKISAGVYEPGAGEIRYIEGEYILFGVTDNRFEKQMASIVLGDTKESAILTLEDLQKIIKKETKLSETLVVRGFDGKYTRIFKHPMSVARFSTDGIAGTTDVLWTLRNKFGAAKQLIRRFEEPDRESYE